VRARASTFTLIFSKLACRQALTLKLRAMFDFQKLEVYQKAKSVDKQIKDFFQKNDFNRITNDQLLNFENIL